MKVKELIEQLKQYNQEKEVCICVADMAEGGDVVVPITNTGDCGDVVQVWNPDLLS